MKLAITIDIDNDGVSTSDERNRLTWSSVDVAPSVRQALARLGFRATWFVRADDQLRQVYGRCDHILQTHAELWRAFRAAGDEIAWHPHLYSRDAKGLFVPERDGYRAAAQFRAIHELLAEGGSQFRVVRIGEAFGSNALTEAMDALSYRIDSSAIPGRKRDDVSRGFDWSTSPNRPFHPSLGDYRVPGNPARKLWQIPMTTSPIRAPREPHPVPRYLNLAYRPEVFAAGLAGWKREEVLLTILHPDELLPHAEQHPLYAFEPAVLDANLASLAALDVESVTMTALGDFLDRQSQ